MLILGQYFTKHVNELCAADQILNHETTCKLAVIELKYYNPRISFSNTESNANWPKGCFLHKSQGLVYWNMSNSGNANVNAQPICVERGGGGKYTRCT